MPAKSVKSDGEVVVRGNHAVSSRYQALEAERRAAIAAGDRDAELTAERALRAEGFWPSRTFRTAGFED